MREADCVEVVGLVRLASLGRRNHQEGLTDQERGERSQGQLQSFWITWRLGSWGREDEDLLRLKMCEFPVVHLLAFSVTPKLISPWSRRRGQGVK